MWGESLGSCQGRATHFTTLWLCEGEGSERRQCHCLASGDCLGGSCHLALTLLPVPSLFPLLPACHLWLSSCCLGGESQRGWFYVSPKSIMGPLRGVSWESHSFFCHPNPHLFLHPEVTGTSLPSSGTLGCVVWSGAGNDHSQGIPPDFYPPHVNIELYVSLHLYTISCLHASLHLQTCYSSGWMWIL